MGDRSELEHTLRDILRVIVPLEEDWSIRFHIIAEIRAVVQTVDSFRGATVEPYGSFVSNLFTRWGDLDISIEFNNGSCIGLAGKKQKQSLLGDLHKALRRRRMRGLQFIQHARVPILKFESNYHISCDISINNLSGQMKSKLLFWINEIDGRFRDMVLLVKEWAKAHGINDSKSGTLNSYSLSLLIIFHFQTCEPALLPPLKEIYPGNLADDLTGVRAIAERQIEEICAENIAKFRSDKSRRRNQSSLSELFVSFLAKFCDISLRASEEGICLYSGQWEQINSNTRWLPKTYALFVEDPFEQPANTARSVSSGHQLMAISEAFQETHRMLTSGNQSLSSLIATLARPQVLQLIPGYAHNSNGYNRTRPQMQRAVQQHQFQNRRTVDRRHNNATYHRAVNASHNNATYHRAVNASPSPVQRAWRPRSDS